GNEWNDEVLEHAARLVLREARQSVAILASNDRYGTSLGIRIRSSIAESQDDPIRPLRLEMYDSYQARAKSMAIVAKVLARNPDYVLVAGRGESAVRLIRQLREAGLERPIICGPDLESRLITEMKADPLIDPVHPIIDRWQIDHPSSGDEEFAQG